MWRPCLLSAEEPQRRVKTHATPTTASGLTRQNKSLTGERFYVNIGSGEVGLSTDYHTVWELYYKWKYCSKEYSVFSAEKYQQSSK